VVAHLGAPEYSEFLTLAERYPRVHLDTTMVFTDFFEQAAPFPADLLPRLVALTDRTVLGSDFPNTPTRTSVSSRRSSGCQSGNLAWTTTGCAPSAGTTDRG
jgi:hypothetical protein